jgi:hypothetical protein
MLLMGMPTEFGEADDSEWLEGCSGATSASFWISRLIDDFDSEAETNTSACSVQLGG